jgi:hypothetical protein
MQGLRAAIRCAPLLTLAILLVVVKSVQFAIDSTALFYYDSGAFLRNALRVGFIPERSYVYGYLIRIFAVPFQSLPAIVAMQVVAGGLTAWLLGFTLIRLLNVKAWIAVLAALAFAFDPVQIVHEHLILTEATALLAMAAFLVVGSQYLRAPEWWLLVLLSFLGILLVSLRIVYLPLVLISAVLLPLAVCFWSPAWPRARRFRALALALAVSCGSTTLLHRGYMELTGSLARREPAYHYVTGFFLVAGVAPIIQAQDSDDARVARAIVEQNESALPLWNAEFRSQQLWNAEGFVGRLKKAYPGEIGEANRAAQHLAYAAILRNPWGFLKLGINAYLEYWKRLPNLRWILPSENGSGAGPVVLLYDLPLIRSAFGEDVSGQNVLETPSRQLHILGRGWYVFLLVSPFLAGIALWLRRSEPAALFLPEALIFLWSCALLAATCLGSEDSYRYLHPFSFTGLIAAALLVDIVITSRQASLPGDSGHRRS